MSDFNECRFGTVDEVLNALDCKHTTDTELRAAVINAFEKIKQLEEKNVKIKRSLKLDK